MEKIFSIIRSIEHRASNLPAALIYLLWALFFFILLVSRRPQVLLNAQFWAEDGRNWYADAYNLPIIESLLLPEAGYLQTFSRICGAVAQLVSLENAPLMFAVMALLVQVCVACFIISDRSASLIEPRKYRYLLAFCYIAIPHSWETYANVTNSQWHIALLALLILLSKPPARTFGIAFDTVVTAISAFSGPFAIFLLPVAIYKYFIDRSRHRLSLTIILFMGFIAQVFSLLTAVRPIQADLGADPVTLIQIAARHLVVSPIIGSRGFRAVEKAGLWAPEISVILVLIGAVLLILALSKLNRDILAFGAVTFGMVAAALISPAVTMEPGQWRHLALYDTGFRYWLFPSVFIYILLIATLAANETGLKRIVSVCVMCLLGVGIAVDWKHPRMPDLDFQMHAYRFERSESGTEVVIPINPDWTMKLKKK